MAALCKDLVLLISQFLDEEGFKETARMLERESCYYFSMKFFEEMIRSGNWDEAERYLSCFTKLDDNRYSTKIYFEIRKQKFLEVLDNNERAKALDILMKELKAFAPDNEELLKEMTLLLTLNNIRDHESLSMYSDAESARKVMMVELKKVIEANPLLRDKLEFPNIANHRLRRLINQSLNWQHMHCAYPQPNPDIRTLFVDHICVPIPSDDNLFSAASDSNPLPSQSTSMLVSTSSASNSTSSSEAHSSISSEALSLGVPANMGSASIEVFEDNTTVNDIFIPKNRIVSLKRPSDEEISTAMQEISDASLPHQSSVNISDDLPKNVLRILNEGSSPTSMEFHPEKQTVLLVGTTVGDVGLWEVSSGESLLSRNFKVWDIAACSMMFKATLLKDPSVSVNRVAWSPEGCLFGVAYSKHLVQIYSYNEAKDARQQLEIDAHVGGVNDLTFSAPEKQLLVITCGDDKIVKAWDATNGVKMYTFEGHDAPVYSLCPYSKGNVHFVFATSVNGNIKVWLYDNLGARVDYDAPGLGCTSMAYSGDRRLFSCGTSKSGESFLVEWDDSEGAIKRSYLGLQKNPSSVVQFDIMKNQVLAAGDEHVIKIWNMNKTELFTTIDAEGGLPANPCVRFNKEGTLLAVSANDNKIKILAKDGSLQLLHTTENCLDDDLRVFSDALTKVVSEAMSKVVCAQVSDEDVAKNGNLENSGEVKSKITGKDTTSKSGRLIELHRPSQCQILRLPSHMKANKISRLIYNNAGNSILALTSNATHLYWKWQQNDFDLSDMATAKVPPQLWQPRSYSGLMTNDLTDSSPEETVPCFALSKNDSYLMSSSGGRISLYNLLKFKTMLSIMQPPPAATCIAFHPQDNNILAIGRDDSTILIYNVRSAKVITILEGHSKRVSGLAFSNDLNLLVSCGADAQIFVWNVEGWYKQRSRFLQIPDGRIPFSLSTDTHIQFHQNQTEFLTVHETHLAIYEARKLECVKQWVPGDFATQISHATFSCDGQMVFASFLDGLVSIFDASDFQLYCQINPTAYLFPTSSLGVYPTAITAHPQEPNQFAVGLTDGGVIVFEPPISAGKWSMLTANENGSASKIAAELEANY
ncbi:PROTEIN putative-RELATED [Salix viminalis]|uniref:PROTEIN putative-RELATED n=1 Tax=Salix viminalis TaxID=40686 RepID=A0A9Q0SEE9_SALVM|nr:PROTEIN putative-RELATED [Salix viminalis]